MKTSISLLFTAICFLSTGNLPAQTSMRHAVMLEWQGYPTGMISGIRFETQLSDRYMASLRLGYNWIRHRDLGKHDDERGNGFGFTLGAKRYFGLDLMGWHAGFRTDIWWNRLDWEDTPSAGPARTGRTKITVIQPTLETGYSLCLKEQFILTPTVSFGWEWNVKTDGEPTGEGAIVLVGVQAGVLF